jgi:hypothetical protein
LWLPHVMFSSVWSWFAMFRVWQETVCNPECRNDIYSISQVNWQVKPLCTFWACHLYGFLNFTIIQLGCKSLVSTLFMVYSDVQYYSIWRLYGICLEPKKYPYHTLWLTCDHLCPQNIFFCWRSDSMHTLLCVIDMAISFNVFLWYLHYFSELH